MQTNFPDLNWMINAPSLVPIEWCFTYALVRCMGWSKMKMRSNRFLYINTFYIHYLYVNIIAVQWLIAFFEGYFLGK